jgi:H+/Cl- antiporter ClcA
VTRIPAGTINWALPATVGNGELINAWTIKYGGMCRYSTTNPDCKEQGYVSDHLLICTGFARMVLLGVSMNCGFVGGIVYPFLTMGILAGSIAYRHYPEVPLGLFVSAFMVALPSGIVPMPFTFTCLAAFTFFLGLYQTVPIFVACIVSFSLVCSSGLMKGLVRRSEAREAAEAAAAAGKNAEAAMAEAEKAKKEADQFALNHYLGNQKKTVATHA